MMHVYGPTAICAQYWYGIGEFICKYTSLECIEWNNWIANIMVIDSASYYAIYHII